MHIKEERGHSVEVAPAAAATLSKREFMMSWFSFVIINICVGLGACVHRVHCYSVLWIIMDCALRPLRCSWGIVWITGTHSFKKRLHQSEWVYYVCESTVCIYKYTRSQQFVVMLLSLMSLRWWVDFPWNSSFSPLSLKLSLCWIKSLYVRGFLEIYATEQNLS